MGYVKLRTRDVMTVVTAANEHGNDSHGTDGASGGVHPGAARLNGRPASTATATTTKRRFARTQRAVRLGTIIAIGHGNSLASRLADLLMDWRRDFSHQDLLVSNTRSSTISLSSHWILATVIGNQALNEYRPRISLSSHW
jgi:hypothetical protein